MPVPSLAPVPCPMLGHTNHSGSVSSGWKAHQKIAHSSQLSLLKSMTGKLLVSLTAAPWHSKRDATPVPECTDSRRQHLPQSKSDRQTSDGQGEEQSRHLSPSSSELVLAFGLATAPACCLPTDQTPSKTKPTARQAQKRTHGCYGQHK